MRRLGFTLLEVLVATAIMGAAVVALLANLSTSMNNATRVDSYDRARILAKRTMEALRADLLLPCGGPMRGTWDERQLGFRAWWEARCVPVEFPPGATPGSLALDRIELVLGWEEAGRERQMKLEAYRIRPLTPEDLKSSPSPLPGFAP